MANKIEDNESYKNSGQESQTIEWKWSWQDEFLKWLCGYANTDGGILYIGVNDDGYVVGVQDTKKKLESLPNKINDKLGIVSSVRVHKAKGSENIRYGDSVPESISEKLINQYICGLINTNMISKNDKRYKALSIIEKENKTYENDDGIREYISIEIVKYPFAISCDGKYYKRSGSTLHELNGFELQNFLIERAGKTWDAVPVPGIGISDLSIEALNEFRKKAVRSGRMTESETEVSDKAMDLIFSKYFKAFVDYEGIQRTETHMLTRGIVREMLLNAINHKLWKAFHNLCYAKLIVMQSWFQIPHKIREFGTFCFA